MDPVLSLNNFSSFYEIFGSYYLILGLSADLRKYFNISTWLRPIIDEKHEKYIKESISNHLADIAASHEERIKNVVENATKNWITQIILFIKGILEFRKLESRKLPKYAKMYNRYVKEEKWLIEKSSDVEDVNTTIFRFINPIYLYFGLISIGILLLSGLSVSWDESINLQIINLASFFVICFLLFQVFLLYTFDKIINSISKVYVFLLTIIFLFLVLVIGNIESLKPYFIILNNADPNICKLNTQIIFAIIFPLIPLILHIILLVRLIFLQKRIAKLYQKASYKPIAPRSSNKQFQEFK